VRGRERKLREGKVNERKGKKLKEVKGRERTWTGEEGKGQKMDRIGREVQEMDRRGREGKRNGEERKGGEGKGKRSNPN
jgi:hypothetical protein